MTNAERLVSIGLLHPLSDNELYKRSRLLDENFGFGGVHKIMDLPQYVVFRSDCEYKHIILDGDNCCQSAEIIMQKLYIWEAARICNRLNNNDPDLPLRNPKLFYKQALYKYATIFDWIRWKQKGFQMKMQIDEEGK